MSKYHSSKLFQFITLVVISGLCLLLDTLTKIHFNQAVLPKNSPEYSVIGADGSVYSKTGKLLYRFVGSNAWKYPKDKRIYLQNLKIYFYDKTTDQVNYQIQANNGWVDSDNKFGVLDKNVIATVIGKSSSPDITLYGNNVSMDLNKNLFMSNNDVKVIRSLSSLTAHGFSYNNDQKFLTLNSKVRVIYAK